MKWVAKPGVDLADIALVHSIHSATAVRVPYMPVTLDKLPGEPSAI